MTPGCLECTNLIVNLFEKGITGICVRDVKGISAKQFAAYLLRIVAAHNAIYGSRVQMHNKAGP